MNLCNSQKKRFTINSVLDEPSLPYQFNCKTMRNYKIYKKLTLRCKIYNCFIYIKVSETRFRIFVYCLTAV